MAEQLRVMISSTARDLPEHRKEAMDACLRQGMFPIMMEHLPASDDEAISASLKMVDDADIYALILAHRYGYVPKDNNPLAISITEMEYNRAVDRKIRRAVFTVDKNQPLTDFTIDDIDTGDNATKLKSFKERCENENIVNFFRSPADLRAHVINSLSKHREADLTAFHYVSDIPAPPEVFIAHPYTLLQTRTLIGRQKELKLLTDWITGKELEFDGQNAPADSVRIMNVVAIGGMGKSALTWKWFNDIASQEMKNLAGRMWWSFYESDATFENFVIRALAYVRKQSIEDVTKIPSPERETQLLAALNRQPFLLVLDGLERILIAYARMDASRLDDSEVGKEKNLRKTADPRVGSFLKKLAQVKSSRILVSSRLYPAELETSGGDPIPTGFRIDVQGLSDEDAVELWRAFGVSGSRDELLQVFSTFTKHPLLIQALAGEVKSYRKAPGEFEEWRKATPNFDPTKFSKTKKAMAHVLEFALRGLEGPDRKVLETIAAFRMPTSYDTLAAVLVGENKACGDEPELDAALNELEDRGLVGWDKVANRYDLHPIVRGVMWLGLGDDERRSVYTSLHAHFKALPEIGGWQEISSIESLAPVIELYYVLIGLKRFEDAAELYHKRIESSLLYRLGSGWRAIELLSMLFPAGLTELSNVKSLEWQGLISESLAHALRTVGLPKQSIPLLKRKISVFDQLGRKEGTAIGVLNLCHALALSGQLHESEKVTLRALEPTRNLRGCALPYEGVTLVRLFEARTERGEGRDLVTISRRALRIFEAQEYIFGIVGILLPQVSHFLWDQDLENALVHCRKVEAAGETTALFGITSARLRGVIALALNDQVTAEDRLNFALTRARAIHLIEEELATLVALADLRRRQGDSRAGRELLDDVWELAERGPYPPLSADALNVLAQIERDEGNNAAAVEAATKAYRLAWCDGPPFAYHWGLEKAKQHLKELGAPEPEMPPFDESKFEPMPEVEINPRDEFYVDEESVS